MSDDIVERLRQQATIEAKKFGDSADIQLEWKAASEIVTLRVENDHLKQARSDALAGGDALREEIARLRAGLQRIVEGDGFWDAPSLARDLLAGRM
jgi:hypothetical protein